MSSPLVARPVHWVELTPDYRCNNRCQGCFSVDDAGPAMSSREGFEALARGRATGARWLWLGGGEPTLRKDLFAFAREARRLGYERVKLQTNGMMLAYEAFVQKAADAGIDEVAFSLKGSTAELHDAYARTPGTFDLMVRGIENARARGLALEGDVLVYASSVGDLPRIVETFASRGLQRFRIWLLSAAVTDEPATREEVPRISEVARALEDAMAFAPEGASDFLVSLHTPPCTLPSDLRSMAFDAAAFGLLVVNPGGHSFRLEQSPIEGGHYLPGCAACTLRPRCGGPRADYVARHGSGEFVPIE